MQRPDRLSLFLMHMLHSFYVTEVDVRGTENLGASNEAAGKCLAPVTSRAGTRELSLPVPESERILREGARGPIYGGQYFGCCNLCERQPLGVGESTVPSSAHGCTPREAAS